MPEPAKSKADADESHGDEKQKAADVSDVRREKCNETANSQDGSSGGVRPHNAPGSMDSEDRLDELDNLNPS
jgi:hypothetical protein